MKIRMILMLAAGCLLASSAVVQAEDDITVQSVSGPVTLIRAGEKTPAQIGTTVSTNTAIGSNDDQVLTFASKDRFAVKTVPCPVCHKTITMVVRQDQEGSVLGLVHGGLLVDVNKMPEGRSFEIHTPLAISSVRGTRFCSYVQHNGDETLSVNEGTVSIKNFKDGSVSDVKAGEAADISSSNGALRIRPSTDDEKTAIDQAVLSSSSPAQT